MDSLRVASFYHFAAFPDFASVRGRLKDLGHKSGIRGTILLAPEGVNGTIAGSGDAVQAMLDTLRDLPGFTSLTPKYSSAAEMPFRRFKVRLKKEIVTMGVAGLDPSRLTGTFVEPEEWNALLGDPRMLVIDTRNHFEVAYGSFAGAVDPATRSFGEFPNYVRRELAKDKSRPVAMFCTGGIRCEKASSFLLREGFSTVYQLKGGILNYLERIPHEQSLWDGRCFVFDEREALGHGLVELHESRR